MEYSKQWQPCTGLAQFSTLSFSSLYLRLSNKVKILVICDFLCIQRIPVVSKLYTFSNSYNQALLFFQKNLTLY